MQQEGQVSGRVHPQHLSGSLWPHQGPTEEPMLYQSKQKKTICISFSLFCLIFIRTFLQLVTGVQEFGLRTSMKAVYSGLTLELR